MKITIDKNQNNKYFFTSSFYIAVFLSVKGLELVSIEKTNPRRCQFVFVDTPQRVQLVEAFNFAKDNSPEVMVDVRKFVMAIKLLKDKLYANEGSD